MIVVRIKWMFEKVFSTFCSKSFCRSAVKVKALREGKGAATPRAEDASVFRSCSDAQVLQV